MEFIVTSYKDRRKSPCEDEAGALRNLFEHFTHSQPLFLFQCTCVQALFRSLQGHDAGFWVATNIR